VRRAPLQLAKIRDQRGPPILNRQVSARALPEPDARPRVPGCIRRELLVRRWIGAVDHVVVADVERVPLEHVEEFQAVRPVVAGGETQLERLPIGRALTLRTVHAVRRDAVERRDCPPAAIAEKLGYDRFYWGITASSVTAVEKDADVLLPILSATDDGEIEKMIAQIPDLSDDEVNKMLAGMQESFK